MVEWWNMEPLKPGQRDALLRARPEAQPEDIEEYERLLAQRFANDPDQAPAAAPLDVKEDDPRKELEARIDELHRKLFGGPDNSRRL